jgi:diguanylate cyclase (GGDEF)-like protein
MNVGKERFIYQLVLVSLLVSTLIFAGFNFIFLKQKLNEIVYSTTIEETKLTLKNNIESSHKALKKLKDFQIKNAKKEIKQFVEDAWIVANSIYYYCKKRGYSDNLIKRVIKQTLTNFKLFNGKGYIFIDEVKGKVFLNPAFPQIEGKSMWNWRDLKGNFVHRKFEGKVLYSPNNEGFVSYYWYLPNTRKMDEKISFVKLFKPYHWIIGAGIYKTDILKMTREVFSNVLSYYNVFAIDNLNSFKLLRGYKLKDISNGMLIQLKNEIYYVKYYKDVNLLLASYVKLPELLKNVYLYKKEFVENANLAINIISSIVLFIILVSGIGLYISNRHLMGTLKSLIESEKQLAKLNRKLLLTAYKDDVTGLPNRKKLLNRINQIFEREFCFAILDVRNFKEINGVFGFEGGDRVLRELGKNLKKVVRSLKKDCSIYRIRADQFGVLCCDTNELQFKSFIYQVINKLESMSINVREINLKMDVVAGISSNSSNFLIEAEMALEEAKRRQVDVFVFDEELQEKLKEAEKNVRVALKVKRAIEVDGIVPYYQPIVNLKTLAPEKYEVLMRLMLDGELLSPGDFLPIAKKLSLYRKLSKCLMEKAFSTCAEKGIGISVNISSDDLVDEKMVDWILSLLKEFNIGDKVCFEIVETEAFSDRKRLMDFFFKVKDLGASFAIDDFGSGYSNYEYLAVVKPDFIKIDGSLILKIPQSKDIEKFVAHTVEFARDINIKTVAEFISNEELYKKVKELGIDYGQGFYFGKPSPEIPA